MRALVMCTAFTAFTASTALGQVAEQIPAQTAGATDWFGESALRIRGGARVDIESGQPGFVAVLQMLPEGTLLVRVLASHASGRQTVDLARPASATGESTPTTSGGPTRVPFVVS